MMTETLETYLDAEGRVMEWPGKKKTEVKKLILDYMASKFEPGVQYTEQQVNEILKHYHTFDDCAMLRRELFEQGYMNRTRDGSAYWLTPNTKLL